MSCDNCECCFCRGDRWSAREGEPGHLYIFATVAADSWLETEKPWDFIKTFKLGWALDPKKRIKDIQTGCAETLHIWYETDEADFGRNQEAKFHAALADYRLEGEWFSNRDRHTRWFLRDMKREGASSLLGQIYRGQTGLIDPSQKPNGH